MQKAVAGILVSLLVLGMPVLAQENRGGIAPDNILYGMDVFMDNIAMSIAAGDERALLAMDIAKERLYEASAMSEAGKPAESEIALQHSTETMEIAQRELPPQLAENAKDLSNQVIRFVQKNRDSLPTEELSERAIAGSEKMMVSAEAAVRAAEYCGSLAKQSIEAVKSDPYCSGTKASDGVRRFVESEVKAVEKDSEQAVTGVVQNCVSSGKCDCSAILVKEYRDICVHNSENALKCGFQGDQQACMDLDKKIVDNPTPFAVFQTVSLKEIVQKAAKEAYEKDRPVECSGKTAEECSRIFANSGMVMSPTETGVGIREAENIYQLIKSIPEESLSSFDLEQKKTMLADMQKYLESMPERRSEPTLTAVPTPSDMVSSEGLKTGNPSFPYSSVADWEAAGKPYIPGSPPQTPPEGFASWTDYENFARSLAQKSINLQPPKGFSSWQDWQSAGSPNLPDVPSEVYAMAHGLPPVTTTTVILQKCMQVITQAYNPVSLVCSTFPNNCLPEGWVQGCPSDKAVIPAQQEPAPPAGFSSWQDWYSSGAPAVEGVSSDIVTRARESIATTQTTLIPVTNNVQTVPTTIFTPIPTTVPPVVPSTIPEAPVGFSSWQEWYNAGAPAGDGIPQDWVNAAHSAQQIQPLLPSVTTTTSTTIIVPTTLPMPAPQPYNQPAPPAGFTSWEAWYNSGAPAVDGVSPEMLAAAQQALSLIHI